MTRFRRDIQDALTGDEMRVLVERRVEIGRLTREARSCKNRFRLRCIAQEVARLKDEYEAIEERMI